MYETVPAAQKSHKNNSGKDRSAAIIIVHVYDLPTCKLSEKTNMLCYIRPSTCDKTKSPKYIWMKGRVKGE